MRRRRRQHLPFLRHGGQKMGCNFTQWWLCDRVAKRWPTLATTCIEATLKRLQHSDVKTTPAAEPLPTGGLLPSVGSSTAVGHDDAAASRLTLTLVTCSVIALWLKASTHPVADPSMMRSASRSLRPAQEVKYFWESRVNSTPCRRDTLGGKFHRLKLLHLQQCSCVYLVLQLLLSSISHQ